MKIEIVTNLFSKTFDIYLYYRRIYHYVTNSNWFRVSESNA